MTNQIHVHVNAGIYISVVPQSYFFFPGGVKKAKAKAKGKAKKAAPKKK